MKFHLLSIAVLSLGLVEAASKNGPCKGKGGAPGTCIATGDCTKAGGSFISNACPGLPNDIKCCSKTSCGKGGNCRFTNDCNTGNVQAGLCPGPAGFKCCLPKGNGGSSFPDPKLPAIGGCKKTAVDGARKIIAGNKGRTREVFCTRNCPCPSNSEHCCGLATDMMCTSAGGVRDRDSEGEKMAEWIMNNRKSLNLKYVIWGQKIWSPTRDKVGPWSGWRKMEDRGSITQNHWDHVHVSYNG